MSISECRRELAGNHKCIFFVNRRCEAGGFIGCGAHVPRSRVLMAMHLLGPRATTLNLGKQALQVVLPVSGSCVYVFSGDQVCCCFFTSAQTRRMCVPRLCFSSNPTRRSLSGTVGKRRGRPRPGGRHRAGPAAPVPRLPRLLSSELVWVGRKRAHFSCVPGF